MALDLRTWKAVYKLFDPTARLEVWDQELFVSRPGSVTDAIARDLRTELEPEGKWVVCGSMGSGKSSELVHLAAELRQTHGIIALDLPNSVARIDRIQPAEVLFLIGAAALRTLEDDARQEPDQTAVNQLVTSFRGLLAENATSVNIGDILKGVALFAAWRHRGYTQGIRDHAEHTAGGRAAPRARDRRAERRRRREHRCVAQRLCIAL